MLFHSRSQSGVAFACHHNRRRFVGGFLPHRHKPKPVKDYAATFMMFANIKSNADAGWFQSVLLYLCAASLWFCFILSYFNRWRIQPPCRGFFMKGGEPLLCWLYLKIVSCHFKFHNFVQIYGTAPIRNN